LEIPRERAIESRLELGRKIKQLLSVPGGINGMHFQPAFFASED
jgi:hypothetical protein